LDLYAVITPDVIKNNINKVPKKYRKQALQQKGEMQMGVGPMVLIPTTLIISPPTENVDLGIYGAIWDFFGLSFPLVDGEWGDFAFFAKLPTIQISLAHGSVLEQPEFMIAGGGSLGARLLFRITPTWHLEGKYVHNLYVPLDLGTVQFSNGLKQELTYAGVASVLIHHRIPYKYK
jgi:hypothetical protein